MDFKIKKLGNDLPDENPPKLSLRDKVEGNQPENVQQEAPKLSLRDKNNNFASSQNLSKITCPECSAELDSEAVICIQCGTNIKSGKQLKTKAKKTKVHRQKGHKKKGSILIAIAPLVIVLFVLALSFQFFN